MLPEPTLRKEICGDNLISLEIVRDFMYTNFTQVIESKNGTHFLARCSLCGDSKKNTRKKRFNLDYKNGKPVYRCWNCGASGSFFKLYMLVKGCSEEQASKDLFKYDTKRLIKVLSSPRKSPESVTYIPTLKFNKYLTDFCGHNFPVNSYLYPKYLEVIDNFIKSRKIPPEYHILYAFQGDFIGRLIIPVFDKSMNLEYFQARRLPGSNITPKYKNPIAEKQNIILNKERFRIDRCIIITEGLLDAFMIGPQGTTCLGKELSSVFLKKLKKYTNEAVILAFDNDEEGQKSMLKVMNSPVSKMVKYFIMPSGYDSKDINKLQCDHNIENMYSFVVENSFELHTTMMKLKFGDKNA